jgi:hypothetical protein
MKSILVALFVFAVAASSIPAHADNSGSSLLVGGRARISAIGAQTLCLETKDDVDAAARAAASQDRAGFLAAVAGGIYLASGTHVRAIDDGGYMNSIIRVRVLDGQYVGTPCWFRQGVGAFKDITRPNFST